ELGADLLLQQSQRAGRALFLDRELAALAAQLGEAFACFRKALLGFAARPFRGERALAGELGRPRRLLRVRRRPAQVLLRRLQPDTRVALLRDERAETFLFIGDAPLRRADLLAERVADADRRTAAL